MPSPISDEECAQYAEGHLGAPPGDTGVFRVTNIVAPDGKPEKWPFQVLENRDSSHLQDLAVSSVDELDAIVVDSASIVPGREGDRTSSFRTVAVFAESGARRRLISIRRRDEAADGESTSLCCEALAEFRRLLERRRIAVSGAPVISLEPELSRPSNRRELLLDGTSYAIKVEPQQLFSHRTWDPDDPLDDFALASAESMFVPDRADGASPKPACMAIRDLQDRRTGRSGAFEEYLFRFPAAGQAEYFIARAAASSSARPAELLRGAADLARKASLYARAAPGRALRLKEFHSPRIDRYYQAMRIVDRGLFCRPGLEKNGQSPDTVLD